MAVKKVIVDRANRLHQLPPEILSFLPSQRQGRILRRTELIDCANLQWPVEYEKGTERSSPATPASPEKLIELREALAAWMESVHGVTLHPEKQIFVGGGLSQIVLSLCLGFIDNGDIAFVPDVAVPLYRKAIAACGGQPVGYQIAQKDNWQPNFEKVSSRLGRVARMLFLNSPHNPTGAVLNEKEMTNLVWIAGRENIMLINDAAYQTVGQRPALSLLAVEGGGKVGVEIGSFSYHFGLPRWPFGFAAGNREVIHGLVETQRLLPGFVLSHWVDAALRAMGQFPSEGLKLVRARVSENGGEVARLLKLLELERTDYDTIPFAWSKIEHRRRSTTAANLLYRRTRVLVAPGKGFGDAGDGYLRFSLLVDPANYGAAFERIQKKLRFLKFSEAE